MYTNNIVITRTVYHNRKTGEEYDNPFAQKVFKEFKNNYGRVDFGKIDLALHNNYEFEPQIDHSVGGKYVFLIHQFLGYEGNIDPNIGTIALFDSLDALKRARAEKIIPVIPFYPYTRSDQKHKPRISISAKMMLKHILLDADAIITADMHSGPQEGFVEIPVLHMKAMPLFVDIFAEKDGVWVPTSPDVGGVSRVRSMRNRMNNHFGYDKIPGIVILDKYRPADGEAEIVNIIGKEHVKGNNAVELDDMVDTGGSICEGAVALKEKGDAERINACVTHPILSDYKDKITDEWKKAVDRINESPIERIYVTDSIPLGAAFFKENPKFEEVSLAPMTSNTIYRVGSHGSVSELYEDGLAD